MEAKAKELELYLYWVKERESIRIKKEEGLPRSEWTTDPILQRNMFCNVRREDDRVTKWVKKNVRDKYEGHPNYIALITLTRYLNRVESMDVLFKQFVTDDSVDWDGIAEQMALWKVEGVPAQTIAYVTTAIGKGEPKFDGWLRNVFKPMSEKNGELMDQLRASHDDQAAIMKVLSQFKGVGKGFMNNQVLIDLAHTSVFPDDYYKENGTFIGPGSHKGLKYIFGDSKDWEAKMRYQQVLIKDHTGMELSLHDVQNTNCEFSKYYEFTIGKKRKIRKYKEGRMV